MQTLVFVIPTWIVAMVGYGIYKKAISRKGSYSNDVSARIRKIKLKNERYLSTKSIFK